MTTLAAQLAPQRSTQYADLVAALARPEVQISPVGASLTALEQVTLGGQPYLRLDLPAPPTADQLDELGRLATIHALFELLPEVNGTPGPWLRPLESGFIPAFPPELLVARRYRGKTNELLAQFMVNIARASSRFAQESWTNLRVFDPLAGGGTLLFAALLQGAEVAGIEQELQDVRSTATFVRQFAHEAGIACRVREERLRRLGRRWALTLGKSPPRRCVLAQGDTTQAPALIAGFKPHLLVTDLPYGIQHQGPLADLLTRGLPVWAGMLPPGGALVLAWDATRFERAEMIGLAEGVAPLTVLAQPPYTQLAHRVDRVIKRRDILVARRI